MSFPTTLYGKTDEIYRDLGTDQKHMLGTRLVLPDGRVFRYAKAGGALTIGRVIGMAVQEGVLDSDVVVQTARTTAEWDAGTHTIEISTSANTTDDIAYANRFDDGYIWVNDEDGEGQMLQIKSHEAATTNASTPAFTIYDEDLLHTALTTASQVGVIKNLYDSVTVHTGTTGGGPALGVAPRAVDSGDYCWVQTWGPCPVMAGPATLVHGDPAVIINDTGGATGLTGVAGSVYPIGDTTVVDATASKFLVPRIGTVLMAASADAEYGLIYLTIAP